MLNIYIHIKSGFVPTPIFVSQEAISEAMSISQRVWGTAMAICQYYQTTLNSGWWFGTFFIFHNIWDNSYH